MNWDELAAYCLKNGFTPHGGHVVASIHYRENDEIWPITVHLANDYYELQPRDTVCHIRIYGVPGERGNEIDVKLQINDLCLNPRNGVIVDGDSVYSRAVTWLNRALLFTGKVREMAAGGLL